MASSVKGLSPIYLEELKDKLSDPNAKKIHFYEYEPSGVHNLKHSWYDTWDAINLGVVEIHTTQMGLMDTGLWRKGYRIYIHSNLNGTETVNEILYGKPCELFGRKSMNFTRSLFREWIQRFVMRMHKEV